MPLQYARYTNTVPIQCHYVATAIPMQYQHTTGQVPAPAIVSIGVVTSLLPLLLRFVPGQSQSHSDSLIPLRLAPLRHTRTQAHSRSISRPAQARSRTAVLAELGLSVCVQSRSDSSRLIQSQSHSHTESVITLRLVPLKPALTRRFHPTHSQRFSSSSRMSRRPRVFCCVFGCGAIAIARIRQALGISE